MSAATDARRPDAPTAPPSDYARGLTSDPTMFPDGHVDMVDTDAGVVALAERLARATVIGVDTESDSMYHYAEKVCLLQFTDPEGDVILDPLACTDLSPLAPVFDDPSIVKVFHGADYDVVCLQRDYGFRIRNLFDTLFAAQFLNLKGLGLADLIDRYFGLKPDKKFQRHDWSRRPLKPEHLDYARGDTHFLLALHEILVHQLRRAGLILHHTEECEIVSQKTWQGRSFDPAGFLRMKGANSLDDTGLRVLKALYLYRDGQARKLDRPPYKVLGDRVLVAIAKDRPTSTGALDKAVPGQRGMKRRHADALVRCVREGLDDDAPLPDPPSRRRNDDDDDDVGGPPARVRGRPADALFNELKAWRNARIEAEPRLSPYTLASNGVLKAIARARPFDLDELAAIPDVRAWQVAEHGEDLLAVLEEHAPKDSFSGRGRGRRRRGA